MNAHVHARGKSRHRLRDFVLYCLIGVGLIVFIILYGNYQIAHHETGGFPLKWVGFAILTALVFGNQVRFAPQRWGSRRFWTAWSLFLAAHFLIGIVVLLQITKVGMLEFFIVLAVEYWLVDRLLDTAMKREEYPDSG